MKPRTINEGDRIIYYRMAVGVVTAVAGDDVTVRESASEWRRDADIKIGDVIGTPAILTGGQMA